MGPLRGWFFIRPHLQRQLAFLLRSGFPPEHGLFRLADAVGWRFARWRLERSARSLQEGAPLSVALASLGRLLPSELLKILPSNPRPELVAAMLELELERDEEWKQVLWDWWGRFFYLSMIVVVEVLATGIVSGKVLPVMLRFAADSTGETSPAPLAPLPTRLLYLAWPEAETVLVPFIGLLVLSLPICVLAIFVVDLRQIFRRLFNWMPVARHEEAARISKVIAEALRSGSSLPAAVEYGGVATSPAMRDELKAISRVLEGVQGDSPTNVRGLPASLQWCLTRSMSTDRQVEALHHISSLYRTEAQAGWSRLLARGELMGLLLCGALTLWVAVAVLLPLWESIEHMLQF